jgi:hypothetical protein
MRYYREDGNAAGGLEEFLLAPTRGLRTNTALAGMNPEWALQAYNVICQPDALVSRPGSASYATGLGAAGKTLFSYHSAAASKLFCATSSGIYDVSAPGAVGAPVATLAEGEGEFSNFSTSAGHYVYFCSTNPADKPQLYNGTAWTAVDSGSSPAITGYDSSDFHAVTSYRQRLFFLAQDRLSFFYLPVDSVGGAATEFRVGSLCSHGGYAAAQTVWSVDGGQGMEDRYLVVTSQGELLIFAGGDPGAVDDWSLLGVFFVGKPVGRRPFAPFGGDLLYYGEGGVVEVSRFLGVSTLTRQTKLAEPIAPSLASDARQYASSAGWQIQSFPKYSVILVNVPASPSVQYCYNTLSKGWSTFGGWDAFSFHEFGGELYFSSGTAVYKAFTGTSDNGAAIPWIIDTAFSRFRTLRQLQPHLVRPLMALTDSDAFAVGFAQDFDSIYHMQMVYSPETGGAVWDSGLWDTALWGSAFNLQRSWYTVASRPGLSLSTRLQGGSATASYAFLGIDYKFARQGLVS